jgi:hypothetical protein
VYHGLCEIEKMKQSDGAVGIVSGTASEKVSTIFAGKNFAAVFEQDIRSAMHEIVICASHLRKNRVTQMRRAFSIAQINGARIVVITKPERKKRSSIYSAA